MCIEHVHRPSGDLTCDRSPLRDSWPTAFRKAAWARALDISLDPGFDGGGASESEPDPKL